MNELPWYVWVLFFTTVLNAWGVYYLSNRNGPSWYERGRNFHMKFSWPILNGQGMAEYTYFARTFAGRTYVRGLGSYPTFTDAVKAIEDDNRKKENQSA